MQSRLDDIDPRVIPAELARGFGDWGYLDLLFTKQAGIGIFAIIPFMLKPSGLE